MDTINILNKHLPKPLVCKLRKYVTAPHESLRSHLDWTTFKNNLDKIDLETCAQELLVMFENLVPSDANVKTFHIANNLTSNKSTEPNHKSTTVMIYGWFTYIYQRHVLATVVKYVLLKNLLHTFESSKLTTTKKGIFSDIQLRLQEICFENVLVAFNGQNYDNYLICNSLIIILTKLKEKIFIYKKGSSISTVKITVHKNLNRFQHKSGKVKTDSTWLMSLFIKDIRNMFAANMSLDRVGKLFNLNESKLCFPYEQAKSIKALKTCHSLHPYNNEFWVDTFSSKEISLEKRLHA